MKNILLNNGMVIDSTNYKSVCKDISMPYCVFKGLLRLRHRISFSKEETIGFYDIETEGERKFKLGYVNDRRFDSPEEMCNYLSTFTVIAGFNNFRFDNEVLCRDYPKFWREEKVGGFSVHKMGGSVNIDLLSVFLLCNPYLQRHSLNELAVQLGIKREVADYSDLDAKCREDIRIMKEFWVHASAILNAVEENFCIDAETIGSMYHGTLSKFRRWCLQSWALQKGIYPVLLRVQDQRKLRYYKHFKKGFYENIDVWDVKSAYPTTAQDLNCSLWKKGDFAEYERFLVDQRRNNPATDAFFKWIANASVGDMGFDQGLLYDKRIICDVWLTFRKRFSRLIRKIGKENIVYSFTDSLMKPAGEDALEMKGYEIRKKRAFRWIAIYNQNRYFGMDANGDFHKVHFDRRMKLKLYDYIDSFLYLVLKDMGFEQVRDALRGELFTDPLNWLEFLPADAFEITVFKDSEVCRNIEYFRIWSDLPFGLNRVYYGERGIVADSNRIDHKKYLKYFNDYIKLYRLRL